MAGRPALAEAVVEVAVLDRLLPVVAAAEAVVYAAAPTSQVVESDGLRSTRRAPVEDLLASSVRAPHATMFALGGQKNWVHLCRWSKHVRVLGSPAPDWRWC